jgi:Protein of unknown function (DUF1566)/EF hand
MTRKLIIGLVLLLPFAVRTEGAPENTPEPYRIVDTGQNRCYDDRTEITFPKPGAALFGQDGQYAGHRPSYRDNGNGTVTDLNTGLMWQADPGAKRTFEEAGKGASKCRTGGHEDWRLPSIKELYSLILFSGTDPDPMSRDTGEQAPFIDAKHFKFEYGKESDGERVIDSQYASSTKYVGTTMGGQATVFGVNFADGRIKGYGLKSPHGRGQKTFCVLYVRGNRAYGKNEFKDNGNGTVTDHATGLTWMKVDSGKLRAGRGEDGKLNWSEALRWAEDLKYAGHSDWRLPNAKELQSIVDYTRSPDTSRSPAIDPVFECTPITNEGGKTDYAHYWTSTSHLKVQAARAAVYISFGRGLGFMTLRGSRDATRKVMDVHGAGSQRSDPKSGDPTRFPQGRGPQGDVIRIDSLVRCVRGGKADLRRTGPEVRMKPSVDRPEGKGEGDRDPGSRPGKGEGGPGGRQGEGRPSGDDFVRRLDRNGDGKVSRSEFDGPANHFSHLDRNGDGYISREEAAKAPPPRRR